MGQVSKGTTYTSGSPGNQVTYTNLNAHVDNATLLPGAISEQTTLPAATESADALLIYDSSAGTLRKVTLANLLYALQVTGANLAAGALTADADGLTKMADGYLAASTAGRAKMASAFLLPSKDQVTQTLGTSGSVAIDWGLGWVFSSTLTGNIIFSAFNNATDGQVIILAVTQSAAGSNTVTWGPTIRWRAGTTPTLTTTANKTDIFSFVKVGSVYYGNYVQNF